MMKRICASLVLVAIASTVPGENLGAQTVSTPASNSAAPERFGISLPAEEFTLPNGLRVVVHTDRSAPIVSVNIWYHVGSRNESAGRTGFAHLFEHLMFNGSENFRDEFFRPFELVGVTDANGSTGQDRTNYYETVPTPALDLALWMESDRMGHLLGAIDQKTLDEQRGVVQNEKRQRYGQPYGLVNDRLFGAIFPSGHPYHHTPIGSMADLDAASLEDVKSWFKSWYGPNNATLVLAGDIDLATAKEKVTKYFGAIAPSASVAPSENNVPALTQSTREIFPDKVPQVAIYQGWPVAGQNQPDAVPLQLLAQILGSSGSSRLRARLMQTEQLVTKVSAGVHGMELAGIFVVTAQLKDGVDPAKVEAIIDQEIRRLIDNGPTEEEVVQARTASIAAYINGIEKVSARANLLNQCATYSRKADCWKDDLAAVAAATPQSLKEVARRWLDRGSHTIEVTKSDVAASSRAEEPEKIGARPPMTVPAPDSRYRALPDSGVDRRSGPPAVTNFPEFNLQSFKRATLSNGMKVILIERHGVPLLTMMAMFPSGSTAMDAAAGGKLGRGSTAMGMLLRGAGKDGALALAARLERLGSTILPGASRDSATMIVSGLRATLPQTLDVVADMLLRPRFDPSELDRAKLRAIASLRQTRSTAAGATERVLPALLYGADHPYAEMRSEESIRALTRADLIGYMRERLDPKTAQIVVAGDITMGDLVPLLEARFSGWKGPSQVVMPSIPTPPIPTKPRIFLIDQPGVPQSTIRVGQIVPPNENNMASDALETANSALGAGFTSRLNMDLREDKHWSYGASAAFTSNYFGPRMWRAASPVQADRTADAMRAIFAQIEGLDTRKAPVTAKEIAKVQASLYTLPGALATNFSLVALASGTSIRGWPDDYYREYSARIRIMTPDQATEAFARTINLTGLTWVVMGPLDKIEAPIRALGIGDVTVIDADGKPVKRN